MTGPDAKAELYRESESMRHLLVSLNATAAAAYAYRGTPGQTLLAKQIVPRLRSLTIRLDHLGYLALALALDDLHELDTNPSTMIV